MTPTPKQAAFLLLEPVFEVLFGGAAGGGKSEVLLAEAIRHADKYPTTSLLIRRTFKDLSQPGGLIDRSHKWWKGTDAHWNGSEKMWTFPSGAVVKFGYLENEKDHLNYQGGEYDYVGFDELTQLREHQYLYLFSRVRKLRNSPVKPRVRAATNPGGPGHEWVKRRFNLPYGPTGEDADTRRFVFSKLEDNPHLDIEEYDRALAMMAAAGGIDLTLAQLREGDWDATGTGGWFDVSKLNVVGWHQVPRASDFDRIIRMWDFGTTAPTDANPSPDWTVGMKIGVTKTTRVHEIHTTRGEEIAHYNPNQSGRTVKVELPDYWILDIHRFRLGPGDIETQVKSKAYSDGLGVSVWLEEERGAAGKNFVYQYRTHHLPSHRVRGMPVKGDKKSRGRAGAAVMNMGRLFIVDGDYVSAFRAEADSFDGEGSGFDDQIDTLGYGIEALDKERIMTDVGVNVVSEIGNPDDYPVENVAYGW